jgi:3-polyprenyl-4-hydroxybenzoate decarboxylase
MVKARTVDAYAVADSEVVLEGYVNSHDRRYETGESEEAGVRGRFHFHPECAGYMGKAYKAPTFHCTAVTMRKPESKPITFCLAVHTMDDHNIDTTVREAAMSGYHSGRGDPVSLERCGHPGEKAKPD